MYLQGRGIVQMSQTLIQPKLASPLVAVIVNRFRESNSRELESSFRHFLRV